MYRSPFLVASGLSDWFGLDWLLARSDCSYCNLGVNMLTRLHPGLLICICLSKLNGCLAYVLKTSPPDMSCATGVARSFGVIWCLRARRAKAGLWTFGMWSVAPRNWWGLGNANIKATEVLSNLMSHYLLYITVSSYRSLPKSCHSMDVVLIFDETSVKLREISPAPGMKIRMDPSAGHVEACIAG